ncbi:MAG: hypothetical protein AAF517_22260, partial [Planctomycetota bacterium]
MRQRLSILALSLLSFPALLAQSSEPKPEGTSSRQRKPQVAFVDSGVKIPGGKAAWADFDHDGDTD